MQKTSDDIRAMAQSRNRQRRLKSNPRGDEIERIASYAGGEATPGFADGGIPDPATLAQFTNDPDVLNAASTAKWQADEAARQAAHPGQAFLNPVTQPAQKSPLETLGNKLDNITSLLQPTQPAQGQPTFQQESDARQLRINGLRDELGAQRKKYLGYADGGKPGDDGLTDAQRAKLAGARANLGVSNAPVAAAAPVPVPAAPALTPKPAGSIIQEAANIFSNRAKQIDKAAGYNLGGKIKGPGTATSDSIPAVVDTGEPIQVANGERIVSVEQDKALQRIAEMLGYPSVDAMFEALTGKPVGPTIKGGKKRAVLGMSPTEETPYGPYTGDGGSLIKDFKDWQAGKIAETNARIDKATGNAPYSNEGRSVPTPSEPHPVSVPASRPGAAIQAVEPVNSMKPLDLTTKDVVPGGYLDRGAGVLAQRSKNGQLSVTNVGTGDMTDANKQIVDGSASALIDQKNSTYNPAAQLARMQKLRMQSEVIDPTITDPSAKEEATRGLLIQNAGRRADAEAAGARLHDVQARSAAQLLDLHREFMDPKTPDARKTELAGIIRALHGKEDRPVNLQAIDIEEPIDPKQPLLGNKKVPYVFDPRSGTSRPMLQGNQSNDPLAQARAAIARGADPRAVNARLKAMGLPEVK